MNRPQPSPVFAFVKQQLQANPQATFAEVAAKAAEHGMHIPPIVYGRAKAVLGLLPSKERAGETPESQAQPEANSTPNPQQDVDLPDVAVDYFRAVVETLLPSTSEPASQPFRRRPKQPARSRPKPDIAPVAASPIDQLEAIVRSLRQQLAAREQEVDVLRAAIDQVRQVLEELLPKRTSGPWD